MDFSRLARTVVAIQGGLEVVKEIVTEFFWRDDDGVCSETQHDCHGMQIVRASLTDRLFGFSSLYEVSREQFKVLLDDDFCNFPERRNCLVNSNCVPHRLEQADVTGIGIHLDFTGYGSQIATTIQRHTPGCRFILSDADR